MGPGGGVRLEVKNQIRFLELVATAVKDDFLGFHLALKVDLRKMGLLYYAQASSDTLEEALQRGVRYSSIVNEGLALSFQAGGNVGINFEYVGVRDIIRSSFQWLPLFACADS